MELNIFELLTGLGLLFLAIYYYLTSTFNFWKDRGVLGPKPSLVFGNFQKTLLGIQSEGCYINEQYKIYKKEPMFGVFMRRTPTLVITDPDYIKDVLIRDFSSFSDRGMKVNEKTEPLSQHLFSLEPKRWKPLRIKLTPTFTSGKLKEMFYLLLECADNFEHYVDKLVKDNPVIECRELAAKFTTDVIGVCAFGLKANTMADENSEFRTIGRMMVEDTWNMFFKFRVKDAMPWAFNNIFAPIFYDKKLVDFFVNLVSQTMDYRTKNNVRKNDFIDLLMAMKNNPKKVGDIEFTDELITAQAFIFFVAGFETSSSVISNTLYELAFKPSIQEKLRKEIEEELAKNNGQLKYEALKDMKYLHKVVSETLRLYPPVTNLKRKSQEPYTFSRSKISIPTGQEIWIPIYSIHRDPDIYDDPDTFDPERFSEENIAEKHSSFYLPFGAGPRNCIGARFGYNQVKVGLIKILKNYKVETCDETCTSYELNPRTFFLTPVEGIKLKFTKL